MVTKKEQPRCETPAYMDVKPNKTTRKPGHVTHSSFHALPWAYWPSTYNLLAGKTDKRHWPIKQRKMMQPTGSWINWLVRPLNRNPGPTGQIT